MLALSRPLYVCVCDVMYGLYFIYLEQQDEDDRQLRNMRLEYIFFFLYLNGFT